jgi:hypothetical protein
MAEMQRIVLAIVFSVLFLVIWIGPFVLQTPPLVGVWHISTSRVIPRVICKERKKWQSRRSLVHSYEARKVRVVKGFVLQE